MDKYYINKKDINLNYFHFTKYKNIESITENGLLPKISHHARSLEDTKKVFFVEGLDNLLILFDCWIHVCSIFPFIPGGFSLGARVIRGKNRIVKLIMNGYFKWTKINKLHKCFAYKYFDHLLKRYVLLNLDIKDESDFSYDDIDQIKAKDYDKDYLKNAGYSPRYSDLDSLKMDKWNLHTFTDKGISSDKIKLCYVGNSFKMLDVIYYALENTSLDVEVVCPVLWGYLKNRKLI